MKAYIAKFDSQGAMRRALEGAYKHAQQALQFGQHEVVIRKATKSRDQEECYHALIGDIAKQWSYCDRKWHKDDMKRLLVDAFRHETKNDPDLRELWERMGEMRLAPAIGRDGFVALGEQTRRFPKALASAFIDWLYSFGVEQNIHWTDPNWRSLANAEGVTDDEG
jgi:hypothetical protein